MAVVITGSTIRTTGALYSGPSDSDAPMTLYVKCLSCGHRQSTPAVGDVGFSGKCPQCGGDKVDMTIASEPPGWME